MPEVNGSYGKGRYTPDCATGNSFMKTPVDMYVGPGIQNVPVGQNVDLCNEIDKRQRLQPMDHPITEK